VSWLNQDHGALFTKFVVQRSWLRDMGVDQKLDAGSDAGHPVLVALRSQGQSPTKPIFRRAPKFMSRRKYQFSRNALRQYGQ
jgi:hypothetical protein